MSELTVHGKAVTVRTSFRGREWYSLPADYRKTLNAQKAADYGDAIPLLSRVIEAWEFDGDPHDVAAYEQLEVFTELMPLVNEVLIAIGQAAFPSAGVGG